MPIFRLSQIILLICVFYINISSGLYEDQVGKFDWRQRYIGKVKFSCIDLKSKVKRVFVATESNVVAALSLKTGAIVWRQVLEQTDLGVIQNLWYFGSEVITLSGSGSYYIVRGWNPNSGFLTFEWPLTIQGNQRTLLEIDANHLYVVKLGEYILHVSNYLLKSGNATGSVTTITTPWLTKNSSCVVSGGQLHCIAEVKGSDGTVTYMLKSLSITSATSSPSISRMLGSSPVTGLETVARSGLAVLHSDGSTSLFAIEDGSDAAPTHVPPGMKPAISRQTDHNIMVTVEYQDKGYNINGKIMGDVGGYLSELTGKVESPGGTGVLTDMACTASEPRISCYIVISSDDHSAVLLTPTRIIWTREEALASIITVEMLDLPVSDVEAAIEKEFANKEGGMVGMFIRRVMSQLTQMEALVEWLVGAEGEPQPRGGARADMVRDTFGLHKLIVAVTSPAKIFGIDNRNGEIVWQRRVENVEPYIILGKPKVPLYIQRTTRVLPHPAQWTLIFKDAKSKDSVLYVFNPINGQPLEGGRIKLGYKVRQGALLPTADTNFVKGLMLLGPSDRVEIFPASTIDVAMASANTVFLYVLDPVSGEMSGYTMAYSNPKNGLVATMVWRINLGGGGGGGQSWVVAAVAKSPQERVHSQGRVLGDRSVLYKYVNPNLIAVATLSNDPVHKSVLSMHLIDAVSGNIVSSLVHKRASEPIHLVHSENWVVYSYFSDKFRRTEIVSLELYEGKTQTNTTAFSSIAQRIVPFVERQAYIFPYHIMAMKETITEKGITSKHVLVGLSSGGVMEVPWALLDPRRSNSGWGGSGDGREEGLVPYIPELALPPEAIISYNQTLANIAGILTSPAGLESTSLVFVHGLDLFYTRVAPSKTFDVLKDDFEYWLISAVLVGLTAAAYITKKLASRKALRQAWK